MAKSSRACACKRARRTMVLKLTMCCMVLRATMVCRTVDSAVCAFRRDPASRHDNSAGGGGGALADFFREQWSVREYNIIPYDQTVPFQGKGARGRRQGSKTIRGRSSLCEVAVCLSNALCYKFINRLLPGTCSRDSPEIRLTALSERKVCHKSGWEAAWALDRTGV